MAFIGRLILGVFFTGLFFGAIAVIVNYPMILLLPFIALLISGIYGIGDSILSIIRGDL